MTAPITYQPSRQPSFSAASTSVDHQEQDVDPILDTAARCIQKAWIERNTLRSLRGTVECLSVMPHDEFRRCLATEIHPMLKRGLQYPECRKAIVEELSELQSMRRYEQMPNLVPVCTSLPGGGVIPGYSLSAEQELQEDDRRVGHFYLSASDFERFQTMPKVNFPDKAHLDAFVRTLRQTMNLIPSELREEGRSSRARVLIDLLILSGIAKENLGLICTVIPDRFIPATRPMRGCHLAAYVKLPNGEKYVIDTSLNKYQSLRPREWITLLRNTSSETMPIVDKGHQTIWFKSCCCGKSVSVNPFSCVVFTTEPFMRIIRAAGAERNIVLEPPLDTPGDVLEESQIENLTKLAESRCAIEQELIAELANPPD